MLVLLAHASAVTRRRYARALRAAGHEVLEAGGAARALADCRSSHPDVLVIAEALCERDRVQVLDRIKGDPEVFRTAVVLIVEGEPGAEAAGQALRRGAQDLLLASAGDGELVARVQAAGRTKILQEELVENTRRLEAHLFQDPLTRLYNRRFVFAQLHALISAARRHGRPLAVAMLDLDGFKDVNDRHGHAVGDRVLVATGQALRESLRAEDVLGRMGGEEFLVVLPDADDEAAAHAAERLRASVEAMDAGVPMTTSVGYAVLDGDEGADDLVRRADQALYAAKDAGRNRVRGPATLPRRT